MIQRHIIHKQKINLQVARMEEAHAYQDVVSDLMQNELSRRMETVFAELFPSNDIIRIDSLQVDVGKIDPANFETEFKRQFIEQFRKTLSSKKENLSEADNDEQLSNGQSLLRALTFFLEKGQLPWYRQAESISAFEDEITAGFSAREYEYLFEWLRRYHQDNSNLLQRLILQFSDLFLEKLLVHLLPAQTGDWKNIYNDIVVILTVCLNEKRSLRPVIWKYAFHVLLSNSEYAQDDTDDAWAFHLLKLLTSSLDIDTITALAEIKVNKKLKTSLVRGVFKNLVSFLETREQEQTENVVTPVAKVKRGKKAKGEKNVMGDGDEKITAYKRSGNLRHSADEEAYYIKSSGIVILHFFLKPYFEDIGLLAKGRFTDVAAQQRAIMLLHYLATGETEAAEFNLTLQKILCGYPLDDTLPAAIVLTKKEKEESDKLLTAVTDHWAPLKNTSISGLRDAFLQREGKLSAVENGWLLTVEQKTVDILLGKLPWGFSTIRLSWMQQLLNVDWY